MARWDHSGGFSLDGSIRVEGPDRAGLERLLPKAAAQVYAICFCRTDKRCQATLYLRNAFLANSVEAPGAKGEMHTPCLS